MTPDACPRRGQGLQAKTLHQSHSGPSAVLKGINAPKAGLDSIQTLSHTVGSPVPFLPVAIAYNEQRHDRKCLDVFHACPPVLLWK